MSGNLFKNKVLYLSGLFLVLATICNSQNDTVSIENFIYSGVKLEPFNYISGWYAGNSDQMQQALHPKLMKRRVVSRSEVWNVTYEWMINATKSCKGCIDNAEKGQKYIEILDSSGDMASIKVVSNEYVDYLHMAKFGTQWKIVNALWEYKTTADTGSRIEAEQLAAEYINSWKTNDTSTMHKILLPDFVGRMALSLTEVENVDCNWMIHDIKNQSYSSLNESSAVNIEVLDTSNNMASFKINYDGLVEYLPHSYVDNKWYIVNSLRNFK